MAYVNRLNKEPLVLHPENWTRSEWETLCNLNGLVPDETQRIVMHVNRIEALTYSEGVCNQFAKKSRF